MYKNLLYFGKKLITRLMVAEKIRQPFQIHIKKNNKTTVLISTCLRIINKWLDESETKLTSSYLV